MKQYNLDNLPESFGVKKTHTELDKKIYDFYFSWDLSKGGTDDCLYFSKKTETSVNSFKEKVKEMFSSDSFFALIDPIRLETGNWLYCKTSGNPELRMAITEGKLYQVKYDSAYYIQKTDFSRYYFNDLESAMCYFRNATESEILKQGKWEVEKPNIEVGDILVCKLEIKGALKWLNVYVGERLKIIGISEHGSFQTEKASYNQEFIEKHFTFEKAENIQVFSEGALVLSSSDNINWLSIPESYVAFDSISGYHITRYECYYHGRKFVKPYEPLIPYLKEIEELIQKSNAESEFVITYNIEKK